MGNFGEDGGIGEPQALPERYLQLDVTHIRVNELESDLKTSRTNSTTKFREATFGSLGRAKTVVWSWPQKGGNCKNREEKAPGSPHK